MQFLMSRDNCLPIQATATCWEKVCDSDTTAFVQDLGTWVEVWNWFIWQESGKECTCLQFVWKWGLYSRWETIFSCIGTEHLHYQFIYLFENISEGDHIKGFVHQHNSEVYKFLGAAVFDWFICWDLTLPYLLGPTGWAAMPGWRGLCNPN